MRPMGYFNETEGIQFSRDNRSPSELEVVREVPERLVGHGPDGQCNNGSLSEPYGWPSSNNVTDSASSVGAGAQAGHLAECPLPGREGQYNSGQVVTDIGHIRMVTPPTHVQQAGQGFWPSHGGQVRFIPVSPTSPLQLSFPRPSVGGGGCPVSGLVAGSELCKPTISADPTSFATRARPGSTGYVDSSILAKSTVVQGDDANVSGSADQDTKLKEVHAEDKRASGATKEQEVEDLRLETLWADKLSREGYPSRVANQLPLCWAKSTRETYNMQLRRFATFCSERGLGFSSVNAVIVADFLCHVADGSKRPESVLKNTSAALACLCEALDIANPMRLPALVHLKVALIKSGTKATMRRSKVMPVHAFKDLFASWPSNANLDIKQ